ncbi:MAG TPA: Holliday junction resolvase RuvX [bacterium]|jgi:putative Holliday junction resolvase|nr:Holliday junction resolvase RuvX [bacterium]
MKRWLGLDLGHVRIGVALSDTLGMTAQPLTVIQSEGTQKDIIAIGELVNEHEVSQVVVGLPINMDGTESKQTQKIREFSTKLSNRLNVPVFFIDERLTSRQAERMMTESGVTAKKQRGKVDQIAAALLLQSALKGALLTEVPKA